MPFWLKWVALPIVGLFVLFEVIHFVISALLGIVVFLVIGAAAVGVLYYAYNRTVGSLPAAKRRKKLERMKRGY